MKPTDCGKYSELNWHQIASGKLGAYAAGIGALRLSFCIGGPYGHGQQIRERANVSIKLSSMVLNHQIALVVLLEQLYRYKIEILCSLVQIEVFMKTCIPVLVIGNCSKWTRLDLSVFAAD
ncbi:RNA methyltransferase RlmH - like 2 [Theobroma cacao]|nr:RNA methyltransferase RlmH - like 2 [Theobroma cacao]